MNKNKPSLIPELGSPQNKRTRLSVAAGFTETDLLHLTAPVLDFPKGTVLPVLGYCIDEEVDGTPYCVRAYVPGRGTTFAGRQASRFRTALQREVWFGGIRPLFFTEIDVTDHAEALRLERVVEAVVIPMYDYRGFDTLRKAA
ncbi:hypothetical protein [Hymenobacter negativus]|uniref:Uncharacterized protein n=1 Tax=Hymenobacter negativus TaxID=2795026 RepID=A0ABS0Q9T3_9BACT|nr:hypothetical protein [Hymenobacter negativus]MBH8558971.1 hypothetical protein [Hymenobacter negativus]